MALAAGCGAKILPVRCGRRGKPRLYGKSIRLLPVTKVTFREKIAIADRIS
jgi:hypothetical protein